MFSIYLLGDPALHEIRYVGQTSRSPSIRLRQHMSESRISRTHVQRWIQTLLLQNLQPQLFILTEVKTKEEADILEKYWIRCLRDIGCPLTNLTDGGGGMVGYHLSDITKKKLSEALRGKPLSQETKSKMSQSHIGRTNGQKGSKRGPRTPEVKNKISMANKGRYLSLESRKKMSESHRGISLPEETKRKMSEGQKRRWEERKKT